MSTIWHPWESMDDDCCYYRNKFDFDFASLSSTGKTSYVDHRYSTGLRSTGMNERPLYSRANEHRAGFGGNRLSLKSYAAVMKWMVEWRVDLLWLLSSSFLPLFLIQVRLTKGYQRVSSTLAMEVLTMLTIDWWYVRGNEYDRSEVHWNSLIVLHVVELNVIEFLDQHMLRWYNSHLPFVMWLKRNEFNRLSCYLRRSSTSILAAVQCSTATDLERSLFSYGCVRLETLTIQKRKKANDRKNRARHD